MNRTFYIALAMAFAGTGTTVHACTTGDTAVKCSTNCIIVNNGNAYTLQAALAGAQSADMCAGSGVTVWNSHKFPGGVSTDYHYYTTTAYPITDTSQLTDGGFESDHEQTVIPPFHANTEGGVWFDGIYSDTSQPGDPPNMVVCDDYWCS